MLYVMVRLPIYQIDNLNDSLVDNFEMDEEDYLDDNNARARE